MALLPKPYPDEVIGSVIARAVWQNGLPLKVLLKDVFGSNRSYSSFLMGSGLRRLELLAGTDAEEILMCHTVFPYSTAFMPGSVRAGLKSKALSLTKSEDCLSSLTKNVSHGVPYRRVCTLCIQEDLVTYGESYWRREHLLPGAIVCTQHGVKLRKTEVQLRGCTQSSDALLPHMVKHFSIHTKPTVELLRAVTEFSVRALNWKIESSVELLDMYRTNAIKLGYQLPSGDIASVVLSGAVLRHFGGRFLEESGTQMSRRSPWPSLMVRPGIGVPFATAKHVFLQVFLSQGPIAPKNISDNYRTPGKKLSNFNRLDTRLFQRLTNLVKKASVQNIRLTVERLLRDAGSWSIYRHRRERFPKSMALLQQFRKSSKAERQVGVREYGRKRHPINLSPGT